MSFRRVSWVRALILGIATMGTWWCSIAYSGDIAPPSAQGSMRRDNPIARRVDVPLKDFSVTTYGAKDGAPTDVEAMAQTSDGFLWLAATEGLVRFDGATFTQDKPVPLPRKSVSALLADDNGDLWIGYRYGGISRLSHGKLTDASAGLKRNSGGRPSSNIVGFARDRDGTVWVADSEHLYHWDADRWHMMDERDGYNLHLTRTFIGVLSDGTLWVSDGTLAWRLNAARHFESIDYLALWESQFRVSFNDLPGDAVAKIKALTKAPLPGAFLATTVDQSGAVWSVIDPAITRYRWVSNPQGGKEFSVDILNRTGIPYGNDTAVLFADREGNIWAGELGGIERFRPNKLSAVAPRETILGPAIGKGTHGDMWIGSSQNGGVYNVQAGRMIPWPSLGTSLAWVGADKEGTVWFLPNMFDRSFKDIRVLRDGHTSDIPYPPDVSPVFGNAIVDDPRGGKLLSTGAGHGLYRLNNGVWSPGADLPGILDEASARILVDDQGRVWVGYTSNRLSIIDRQSVKTFTATDGLSIGNVKAIAVARGDVWIAGTDGVNHQVGSRFVPLIGAEDADFHGAGGVVKDSLGGLWINATPGLYHVPLAELEKAARDPAYKVRAQLFDQNDGLQGGVLPGRPGPSLIAGDDGKIWAARMEGVSTIDPGRIASNTVAPHVEVQSITADSQERDPQGNPRFKPSVRLISFNYTASSLSMPEKVVFRYRLDGVDRDWEVAGARRQVSYTNLAPGSYAFRVMAANEDGVWSPHEAISRFVIAPYFYQTVWFRLLSVAMASLLIWLLCLLRMHQLNQRLKLRMAEREELSRELHNTLIQGIGSINLHMQLWAEDSGLTESLRAEIIRMSAYAEEMVEEGRERIASLRSTYDGGIDLAEKLQVLAECCSSLRGTALFVRQDGLARRLTPRVAKGVLDINCEAVRNAFAHANATTIEVEIRYGAQRFTTRVVDNGKGIPENVLRNGARPGHWGMPVMQERSAHMGGVLTIEHADGGGTVVSLVVPAARAYQSTWARLRSMICAEL